MSESIQRVSSPGGLVSALEAAVKRADVGWELARLEQHRDRLHALLAPSGVQLEVRAKERAPRSYRVVGRLSYAYRGREMAADQRARLDRVIDRMAEVFAASGFDPRVDVLPSRTDAGFPTPYHRHHLERRVSLTGSQRARYRRDGHLLFRRLLEPSVLAALWPTMSAALESAWPHDQLPVEARPDAYSRSFTQIVDLGAQEPRIRLLTNAPRLAQLAGDLMGVPSVRLFCEDWLIKEPGAAQTPWHQDAAVFPFDASATLTMWIPLTDVAEGEGLLRFARGSHHRGLADIEGIHDGSEAAYQRILEREGDVLDRLPPMSRGDVSVHDGRLIHGAFPHPGPSHRPVLALHFFSDDAVVSSALTSSMRETLLNSAPGLEAGSPARADAWPPVLGPDALAPPRIEPVAGVQAEGRLRAIVLSDGKARDLGVRGGRWSVAEADAPELAAPGGFALAGLVECHGHISYSDRRDDPVDDPAWMNARRADYAETGVTLLRDMGAHSDAIQGLLDVPGLPRVQAAGTMILRREVWPFTSTPPARLREACVERVARGARWVKVFADFTQDFGDKADPGFTEHDRVTYPVETLRGAVEAVVERGGRVAAHCFTEAGTRTAIEAGVHTLEHGWGLDEVRLERMAERGMAWAPLVGIAGAMRRHALALGDAAKVAWVDRTLERLAWLLPRAESMGITLLAGTDQFPSVTVADEVRQLHALGVSKLGALAAGSWGARAYFEEPGIELGAPFDMVLYRDDPRLDLSALERPEQIWVGGRRVQPSSAKIRPRFERLPMGQGTSTQS